MFIDSIVVFYTDKPGKLFARERNLTLHDYTRMMKKLHWDLSSCHEDLVKAVLQKDVQRLRKCVAEWVNSESEKYHDCAIFMKHPMTVQESPNVGYIIHYRIFTELFVGEVRKEK